jgi:hypothetical protein
MIKVTKLIKLSLAMWQSAIFLNEKEKWSQEVGERSAPVSGGNADFLLQHNKFSFSTLS